MKAFYTDEFLKSADCFKGKNTLKTDDIKKVNLDKLVKKFIEEKFDNKLWKNLKSAQLEDLMTAMCTLLCALSASGS